MYFHRANRIKPGQMICLEGIDKSTEILQCTICNPNIHLSLTNNLIHLQEKPTDETNLLNRPPVRKPVPSIEQPLTEYTNRDADRLLTVVARDRKLLLDLVKDEQCPTGLDEIIIVVDIFIFSNRFSRFNPS